MLLDLRLHRGKIFVCVCLFASRSYLSFGIGSTYKSELSMFFLSMPARDGGGHVYNQTLLKMGRVYSQGLGGERKNPNPDSSPKGVHFEDQV